MKSLFLVAAGAVASLALAGAAQAQCCGEGGYLPPPAYASGGYDYAGAEAQGRHFTLAGVRAGVTVLGVDLDAHAGLDIGAHGWGGGHDGGYGYAPARAYAPPPPPPPYGPEGGYEGGYGDEGAMGYEPAPQPAYGGYGRSYDVPCGCGW